MGRARLRDLGITIGDGPPGPRNAITDVPGLKVGQTTIIHDTPRVARTGVTVLLPRGGEIWDDHCYAGYYALNGAGEMTGVHWIDEAGLITAPLAITNTHQVGVVRDAIVEWGDRLGRIPGWTLPVVGETYDGRLNDIGGFHVTKAHVFAALESAHDGPVEEGNTGGGTGMCCHQFKGGTGTASRIVEMPFGRYTVGVIVQANYGLRPHFRVDGVPVGREIPAEEVPTPVKADDGSIIVMIATDAPLIAVQCRRLAQRATVGLARVGCMGHNGSGDIFLAFSTGNHVPIQAAEPFAVSTLPNTKIDRLFEAAAEATEEAILNAMTAAETMTGKGRSKVYALPLDRLQEVMAKYRPKA